VKIRKEKYFLRMSRSVEYCEMSCNIAVHPEVQSINAHAVRSWPGSEVIQKKWDTCDGTLQMPISKFTATVIDCNLTKLFID
jgi:hypothetical protein